MNFDGCESVILYILYILLYSFMTTYPNWNEWSKLTCRFWDAYIFKRATEKNNACIYSNTQQETELERPASEWPNITSRSVKMFALRTFENWKDRCEDAIAKTRPFKRNNEHARNARINTRLFISHWRRRQQQQQQQDAEEVAVLNRTHTCTSLCDKWRSFRQTRFSSIFLNLKTILSAFVCRPVVAIVHMRWSIP